MCQKGEKIKFCSCSQLSVTNLKLLYRKEIQTLKRKETLSVITWNLHRFVKNEWKGLDGMLIAPSNALTRQLTSSLLLKKLNEQQCFDFNYQPFQGDNIVFKLHEITKKGIIKKDNKGKYISFIYRNDKWGIDNYNAFYDVLEEINKGILKIKF